MSINDMFLMPILHFEIMTNQNVLIIDVIAHCVLYSLFDVQWSGASNILQAADISLRHVQDVSNWCLEEILTKHLS